MKSLAADDLNLIVESDARVWYLGPNGAGKTTSIKILADFLSCYGARTRKSAGEGRKSSIKKTFFRW